ncbi:unnamed protein product [Choristocarpus tenellus]
MTYVAMVTTIAYKGRSNPSVTYNVVPESFQLPDIGFCFDGGQYDSQLGCFENSTPEECAASVRGDTFVYGYNATDYTTPEGYGYSSDYVVLLPERLSDTCAQFALSDLDVIEGTTEWKFHTLIFWNSTATMSDQGSFQNVKMYLYDKSLTLEDRLREPVILYAPISFDPNNVPFVRGFLKMEQRKHLDGSVEHEYSVVGVTTSTWINSPDALDLSSYFKTDTIASIQFDVRVQQFVSIEDVDPFDILGILGEIGGFWAGVPLLFGICFYRSEQPDVDVKRRTLFGCGCQKTNKTASGNGDPSGVTSFGSMAGRYFGNSRNSVVACSSPRVPFGRQSSSFVSEIGSDVHDVVN